MTTLTVTVFEEALMVKGIINFDNVVKACQEGSRAISGLKEVHVDLKELEKSDSSGLALLTAWVRAAKDQNKSIQFRNIPAFMYNIIRVCGLDGVLPILWEN